MNKIFCILRVLTERHKISDERGNLNLHKII